MQRGCIWNSGGSNPCRNLLDFNDITVDKTGRVMVGFADGCVPASIEPESDVDSAPDNDCANSTLVSKNGLVQHGAIIRQLSGRGLFAAFDPPAPATGGGSGGVSPTPGSSNGGSTSGSGAVRAAPSRQRLAATGIGSGLGLFGIVLVLAGLLVRRRVRT